jgi:hypothetical protein
LIRQSRNVLRPDGTAVDRSAPAEVAAADVDLDDLRIVGIELLIREIRAEHQPGAGDRLVSGGEPEQAVMPTS